MIEPQIANLLGVPEGEGLSTLAAVTVLLVVCAAGYFVAEWILRKTDRI